MVRYEWFFCYMSFVPCPDFGFLVPHKIEMNFESAVTLMANDTEILYYDEINHVLIRYISYLFIFHKKNTCPLGSLLFPPHITPS